MGARVQSHYFPSCILWGIYSGGVNSWGIYSGVIYSWSYLFRGYLFMELFIHGGVYSGVIYSGGVFSGGVYSGGIYSELFIPGVFIPSTTYRVFFSPFGPKLKRQKTQEITITQGFFPKTQNFGKFWGEKVEFWQKIGSFDKNSTKTQGFFSETQAFFLKTQFSGKSTWRTCQWMGEKKPLP